MSLNQTHPFFEIVYLELGTPQPEAVGCSRGTLSDLVLVWGVGTVESLLRILCRWALSARLRGFASIHSLRAPGVSLQIFLGATVLQGCLVLGASRSVSPFPLIVPLAVWVSIAILVQVYNFCRKVDPGRNHFRSIQN